MPLVARHQAVEELPISFGWRDFSFKLMTDSLFILVITMSMGILSCITTGWWGAVSLTIFSQTNWLRLITVFRPTWPDKRHGNFCPWATSYRVQFYHGGPFPKTRTWRILVPCCRSYGTRRPWRHVVTLPHLDLRRRNFYSCRNDWRSRGHTWLSCWYF